MLSAAARLANHLATRGWDGFPPLVARLDPEGEVLVSAVIPNLVEATVPDFLRLVRARERRGLRAALAARAAAAPVSEGAIGLLLLAVLPESAEALERAGFHTDGAAAGALLTAAATLGPDERVRAVGALVRAGTVPVLRAVADAVRRAEGPDRAAALAELVEAALSRSDARDDELLAAFGDGSDDGLRPLFASLAEEGHPAVLAAARARAGDVPAGEGPHHPLSVTARGRLAGWAAVLPDVRERIAASIVDEVAPRDGRVFRDPAGTVAWVAAACPPASEAADALLAALVVHGGGALRTLADRTVARGALPTGRALAALRAAGEQLPSRDLPLALALLGPEAADPLVELVRGADRWPRAVVAAIHGVVGWWPDRGVEVLTALHGALDDRALLAVFSEDAAAPGPAGITAAVAAATARPALGPSAAAFVIRAGPPAAPALAELLAAVHHEDTRRALLPALGELGAASALPAIDEVVRAGGLLESLAAAAAAAIRARHPVVPGGSLSVAETDEGAVSVATTGDGALSVSPGGPAAPGATELSDVEPPAPRVRGWEGLRAGPRPLDPFVVGTLVLAGEPILAVPGYTLASASAWLAAHTSFEVVSGTAAGAGVACGLALVSLSAWWGVDWLRVLRSGELAVARGGVRTPQRVVLEVRTATGRELQVDVDPASALPTPAHPRWLLVRGAQTRDVLAAPVGVDERGQLAPSPLRLVVSFAGPLAVAWALLAWLG